MANLTIKRCCNCSEAVNENWKQFDKFGNYICPYCGVVNYFSDNAETLKAESELNEIFKLLDEAHFKTAREKLSLLRDKYPKSSKAYFLSVLAENSVCFTKDNKQENHFIPTLNDLPDGDLSNSIYAKKALELAESDMVRDSYQETFNYIEKIRKEIQEAAKKKENQYDIFISTKVTLLDDNGNEVKDGNGNPKESPDCANARTLYNFIQEKYQGKRIFFSQTEEAKTKMAGQKYENVIYAALHSAKAFILVAESRQSIDWRWVRNEWMRYLRIIDREGNENHRFVLVTHSLQAVDLPGELKDFEFINYSTSADPGAKLKFFLNAALATEENRTKLQAKTFDDEVGKIELGEVEDNIVTRKLKTHVEEASSDLKIKLGRIAMDLNPQRAATREKAFKELEDILRDNPDIYEAQKLLLLKGTEYYHFEDYIDNPEEIMKNPSLLEKYIEIAPEKDGKKVIENVVNYINDLLENKLNELFEDKYPDFFTNLPLALSQIILPYLDSIDVKSLESLTSSLLGLIRFGLLGCEKKEDYDALAERFLNHYLILQNYIDKKDPNKYIEARLDILEDLGFVDEENKYQEYEELETKLVNEILKVNPSDYKTIWLDFCLKKFGKIYSNPIDLANDIDTDKVKLPIVGDREAIETFNAVFKYSRGEERERFIFTFLTAIVWDEKSYEKEPGQETLLLTKDIDGNNQIDDYEKNGFDLFKSYIEYKLPENIIYKSTLNDEFKENSPLLDPNINAYLKKEKPNVLDRLLCAFAVKMHRRHFYEQAVVLYDLYLGQQETNKTFDCLLIRYYKELAIVRIADPNELRHVNRRINDSDIKDALYALSATYKPAMVLYDKISDIVEKQDRYFDVYQPIKELANQLPREKTIANVNLICDIRDKFIAAIDSAPEDVKKDLKEDFSYELDYFNNKLPELIAAKKKAQSKKKRRGIAAIIIIVLSLLVVAGLALTFLVFIPQAKQSDYNAALSLLNSGDYKEAALRFEQVDYNDSSKMLYVAKAGASFQDGDYETGIQYIHDAGGTVNVDYDSNGGTTSKNKEVLSKKSKWINNTPTRDGYTFVEWGIDNFKLSYENKEYGATLNLKAAWDIIDYVISYNLNGGTLNNTISKYNVETTTFTIGTPTKRGYTFTGWSGTDIDGTSLNVSINKGSTGNKSFVANYTPNTYTIFLDYGYDNIKSSESIVFDSNYSLPTPTRFGYDFSGWCYNDRQVNNSGTWNFDSDITLVASWTPTSYKINYNLGGGTNNANNPSYYNITNGVVHIQAPTRKGYTFDGWYDGTTTTKDYVVENLTSDISLTAKWTAKQFQVTVNPDGGEYSGDSSFAVTFDSNINIQSPSKKGYTFLGWYYNDEKLGATWNLDSNSSSITLVAHWMLNHYTVTYNLDGGTNNSSNPQTITYFDTITVASPTKEGYTFLGWIVDNNGTYQLNPTVSNSESNRTLTAVWQVNQYRITLDCPNTDVEDGTTIDCNFNTSPSLPTPYRVGSTFLGWYYNDQEVTSSWKMPAYNVTLTAKWRVDSLDFLDYDVYDKTIRILGIKSGYSPTGIAFPETIDGKNVTQIQTEAFANNTTIREVILSSTITKIGEKAFYKCTALQSFSVTGPLSSSIGANCLRGCTSLNTFKIETPSDKWALYYFFTSIQGYRSSDSIVYPSSLSNVIINKGNRITNGMFAYIPASVNIQYKEAIYEVGDYAFAGAKQYFIPSTINSMGEYAYSSLGSIGDELTLPEGLQAIGAFAFYGTTFKTINLPGSLTSLGRGVFSNLSGSNNTLKTINFNGTKSRWLSLDTSSSSYDAWSYGMGSNYKVVCTDSTYTHTVYGGEWSN